MALEWHKEWRKVEGYDYDDLIYEKKYLESGGVARLTINRSQRLNSFTPRTIVEMWQCIDDINKDPSIGVVVLTGAGDKAFSSGGDVEAESIGAFTDTLFVNCDRVIHHCRKPVIAAVKGWCIGGGNHMAYMCDLTIAAENAVFGQNGPRVGSPAAGWQISYSTRVVGHKKAREMWMLCRRYPAHEALQMGLVNAVVPLDKLDEEVDGWCEEILEKSPTCIQLLKATFDDEYNYMRGDAVPDLENRMFPYFDGSEEQKEAQFAFMQKRKPNFRNFIEQTYEEYERSRWHQE